MTAKEIEELAGHRQVPAWVVKLVGDAVAAEREACAKVCASFDLAPSKPTSYTIRKQVEAIRARGQI